MAEAAPLPFHLRGNYAPVDDEVTLTQLPIEGKIPHLLTGVYLRNGPNPQHGATPHWFFGDGMLHGVRLESGRAAWYRNRAPRTRRFAGEPRNIAAQDRTLTTANTHVVRHGGRLLALEEGSFPFEMTADLASIGPFDFGGKLKTAFTAHPKVCSETGEMHGFGYGLVPPFLTYYQIDRDGQLMKAVEIPLEIATMAHDFAITRHHVVLMDLPILRDLQRAGGTPYWSDTHRARVGILPRGGNAAQLRWVEVDPCYVFHVANAYEHAGVITMEVARYPSLWRTNPVDFETGARLHRWSIDLRTFSVTEQPIDDLTIEFPRIDDRRTGLSNRLVFACATTCERAFGNNTEGLDRVIRIDRQTGERRVKEFPGAMVSEFGFAPGGPGEGEGWVMGYVYDRADRVSDLVILAADTLDEVARIKLGRRVPEGFHGNWFSDPS